MRNSVATKLSISRRMDQWQELMREVALHRNVYCKLSGLVTEADYENWGVEQLRPYADHAMEEFGTERVMFGSDWPVCLLVAHYEQVLSAARTLATARLGMAAEEPVFGGNAARVSKRYAGTSH
jgi:L-fuconolactonase